MIGAMNKIASEERLKCPQGCGELIAHESVEKHLRFNCSHRNVTCDFCGKDVVLQNFKKVHSNECPRWPLVCPNGCTASETTFVREEMEEHLKICKKKQKRCKYEYLGCKFMGGGKELTTHEKNMQKHFTKMADMLSTLSLRFDVLAENTKGDVLLLQNENFALREGIKEVLIQFEKLRDETNNLSRQVGNAHKPVKLRINGVRSDQSSKTISTGASVPESSGVILTSIPNKNGDSRNKALLEMVEQLNAKLSQQNAVIDNLAANIHNDGVLLWKITDYARIKEDASSGRQLFILSEPLFTERYGYKLIVKAFLNGDGEGRGTHLSLFVCIARGPWDDVLSWPFRYRVTFHLLDQRDVSITNKQDIKEAFMPNPNLVSFMKPQSDMNVGSGIAKFASHAVVEDSEKYIINDTIYVKITVTGTTKNVAAPQS